jgi:hypothetical protein
MAGMRQILSQAHRILRPGGQLYVTAIARADSRVAGYLADVEAGRCQEIEPLTFAYLCNAPGDKYLPHHYCSEAELRRLLADFAIDDLRLDRREYSDEGGVAQVGAHYHVRAHRP